MKKYFFTVLVIILGLVLTLNSAFAEKKVEVEEPKLTEEQINGKLNEISKKYEAGELLSLEDAEFVKQYVPPAIPKDQGNIQIMKFKETQVYGSNANSTIGGEVTGNIWADTGFINHSFGGKVTTKVTKGRHESIKTRIRHMAFGAAGSGGIGIVYNDSLDASCKKTTVRECKVEDSDRYIGSVAYATTYAEGDIIYGGGSKLGIDAEAID